MEIKTMGANVYLTGVKFVHIATKSFLFSQGTTTNPSTVGFFNSGTIYYGPSSPIKIDVTTVGASQLFIRHFYLPEYYGAEANQDHTIMVLRGTYNGIQTFYAIAVNGHAGAGTYRYSVERNHSYKYNVTIEGRGFDTEARALMPENVTKSFDEGAGNANAFYELISQ